MKEKYSVLMSLYIKENDEYFRLSVDSMINQSIVPDQIVIVLDGPITQELEESVEYFKETYKDIITIVRLEENVGLGLALNEGLAACRNELVARMDTDDVSFSDRCEKQINEFVKDPELSIVGGWTHEFTEDHNTPTSIREVPEHHEDIVKFSKTRSPFNHPTVMYKKNDILQLGGYNDILRNEDYDLFYRVLKNGNKSLNIQEPLILFRSNDDNLTRRKSWVNIKGYIDVSRRMYKDKYINIGQFSFVIISQIFFYIMPNGVVKLISDNLLRKKLISK